MITVDLMDIEKLIEDVKSIGANKKLSAWVRSTSMEAATALSMIPTLQAENEKLRAAVDNWKKKYVETNGKWINAENKWAGLDKAVRNGSVYRPMQEELNLTYEENQSLKDANADLRAELEASLALLKEREATTKDAIDTANNAVAQSNQFLIELEQMKRQRDEAREVICAYCLDIPCERENCRWYCGPEEG